jgi:hypothetical protein
MDGAVVGVRPAAVHRVEDGFHCIGEADDFDVALGDDIEQ